MMIPAFVTAGGNVGNVCVRAYDVDGEPLWTAGLADSGASLIHAQDVAIRRDGKIVVVGGGIFDGFSHQYIRLLDSDGGHLWISVRPIGDGGLRSATVDIDGSIVAARSDTIAKFDSEANLLWEFDHGNFVWDANIDWYSGRIAYAGAQAGSVYGGINLRVFSQDGFHLFSSSTGTTGSGVAFDRVGNCIFAGARNFGTNIHPSPRKFDSSGNLLWFADHGGNVQAVTCDDWNNVIITGAVAPDDNTTRKYDPDGELLWSRSHGILTGAVDVASTGHVITGGLLASGVTTRCYDASGTLLWSANHGATVSGVASRRLADATFVSRSVAYGHPSVLASQRIAVTRSFPVTSAIGRRESRGAGDVFSGPVATATGYRESAATSLMGIGAVVTSRGSHVMPGLGAFLASIGPLTSAVGSPPYTLTFDHLQSVADEKQNTFQMIVSAGEHRLTIDGNESDPIHLGSGDTLATLVGKLEAISGSGSVLVHGLPDTPLFPMPYVVEFIGSRANQANPLLTIDNGEVIGIQIGSALFA